MTRAPTDTLTALADVLHTAGFSARTVEPLLSIGGDLGAPQLRRVAAVLALGEHDDERLALLVALFALGVPVARARVRALLPGLDLAGLGELGFVRAEGEQLVSEVRIDELEGLLLVSDMHVRDAGGVVGVSPSTLLSVAHTPRTEVDSALDMGTGSGAHALLAARHAQRVVATDTNPRALRMLRLNAALNAIDNVQTRAGSWFEPVAGERFDLVIANPPYVISPDTSFLYRDGGLRGDALSSTLLRELPAVLKPGGFASLQGNWTHDRDTPWWRTPAACLVAGDCDAFVVRLGTVDALEYALRWVEPHHRDDPGGYEPAVARWRDRYREDRIELISTATVVLRRRTAANWRYAVTRSDWPPYAMGRRWPRLFEAQDRLRCLDGEALLGARMRPVTGLGVQFAVGGDPSRGCLLRAATAVTQRRAVSRATAELVLALEDGGRPGDVAGVARVHPDELRALVKLGFLELL